MSETEKDIFCRIVAGELPAEKVAEGGSWIAIRDIRPQSPSHILIVPRQHIAGVEELTDSSREIAADLLLAAKEVAGKLGLSSGYRLIINQGDHGGQLVPHLHVHLLGGKKLGPKIVS